MDYVKFASTSDPARRRAGGFVQIEIAFLREERLSADARWLGAMLATFANSDRLAWPGPRTLRSLTGMGISRVSAARAELARGGYLRVAQERGQRGRFGKVKYEISLRILYRRPKSSWQRGPP
jgi:hypothetical protein